MLLIRLVQAFYQRIWFYTLAFVALFALTAQDIPEFGSLEEFLVWVGAGGGSMVLAGLVVAYFLENLAFWHGLPRLVKLLVPIALAGLFGFLAQSALAAELLTMIPPVMQGVILMLIAWLFSQVGYRSIKEGDYAKSARIGPDG